MVGVVVSSEVGLREASVVGVAVVSEVSSGGLWVPVALEYLVVDITGG